MWTLKPRQRYGGAALLVSCALICTACGEGEPTQDEPDATSDTTRPPRPKTDRWKLSTLDVDFVGLNLRMATSAQGVVGVAYYRTEGVEGDLCTELGVENPPIKTNWELKYAQLSGDSWSIETVADAPFIGQPPGLDLKFNPANKPVIATMAGAPVVALRYCGVNNAALYTREGTSWQLDTAVSTSGAAASGDSSSDFGFVVGYWPALAFDAAGQPALAYRDVHAGGIQNDDFTRADLEFAYKRGASWSAFPVDMGRGAGNFNRMIFDAVDRPVLAYYNPTELTAEPRIGIWVTRSEDGGASWQRTQLFNRATSEGPDVLRHPQTGDLHVAFYNSQRGYPQLATLSDHDAFESVSAWKLDDIGNNLYDEGVTPSLAVNADGQLAIAYYRCVKASAGLGRCHSDDDALIFAYNDGNEWRHEVVDSGDAGGPCGSRPALAFDAEHRPIIAYRCDTLVDDKVETHVKFARRERLPQ
ncbi:MAG: hypothetical protein H0U74_23490 [Bradymonadaceae bacterium]|nr:hypothetical protein [Lujinxingiaceae bacterium]